MLFMTPDRTAASWPQLYARAGGILYLVVFGLGWTLFGYPHVAVSGDAAATAHAIALAEPRLRLVSAGELIMFLCDVPLALIFYVLLAPVDRNLALLAAFFRLANAFLGAILGLGRLAVLVLFGNPGYAAAISPSQLQAFAALLLNLHGYGVDICFVFFGLHCVLLGYLIYRSEYLPKFIGVLLPIAGVIYVANSFVDLIAPEFAAKIPTLVLLPGFIAELSLCLWLLLRGVNARLFAEQHREL